MKILYATDLHGDPFKYEKLRQVAKETKADICINGGDVLPKGSELYFSQKRWIDSFFRDFIAMWDATVDIPYIFMMGNDDLSCLDKRMHSLIAAASKNFFFMDCGEVFELDHLTLAGYNHVKDYPFRLKDRCTLDTPQSIIGEQYGTGLVSNEFGDYVEIRDWLTEVRSRASIQEELADLQERLESKKNVVFICHNPPFGYGLDVLLNGEQVGSKSVNEFIARVNPILSLHGHIHESPRVTGISHINHDCGTMMVQPGQERKLKYAVIELSVPARAPSLKMSVNSVEVKEL